MDLFGWLPAVSAGAAAVGVLGAAWRYGGSVRDKRRERAAVFAWLKLDDGKPVVAVRNLGEKPVLDVTVQVFDSSGQVAFWRFGMVDAGELIARDATSLGVTASESADPLGLWCTDFTGDRWYRSSSGQFYRWKWFGHRRNEVGRWLLERTIQRRIKRHARKSRKELPGDPES